MTVDGEDNFIFGGPAGLLSCSCILLNSNLRKQLTLTTT